jgi:16S rRNA pseudouridine516 synthase
VAKNDRLETMALERLLQSQGYGTRKGCRAAIRNGLLRVDGTVCDDPFAELVPAAHAFEFEGESFVYRRFAYLVMHKPAGYECSQRPKHHVGVYSLLPSYLREREVQSVGRLDEDTTGLLLFSDDGQFIHALSSGRRKVRKCYLAELKHGGDELLLSTLRAGVTLYDELEPVAAAACRLLDPLHLELTVTEGKYHQVKRMVAAAGNRVEKLERVAVGDFMLPADLVSGAWRWLSDTELRALGYGEVEGP